ncbi:MAG: universal stress protein [Flavobacteriaceae bacterium]
MKTILFPTDFSNNALNGVKYALPMYEGVPCTFILLNAFAVNEYVEGTRFIARPNESLMREAEELSKTNLKTLKANLEDLKPNELHTFQTVSRNYSLIDAINEQLNANPIDLIVIGTQGSTGDYKTVYGSNTISIMEEIKNCPILAIPSKESFTGLNEIVLATGFYMEYEKSDFNFLLQLAEEQNAPLRILTISETGGLTKEQQEHKRILNSFIENVPHSFHILEHVNVPTGIYCFSESRNSSMISFVNKKYTFIEKLLFSPLYKDLGDYSKTPVLVLHRTRDA